MESDGPFVSLTTDNDESTVVIGNRQRNGWIAALLISLVLVLIVASVMSSGSDSSEAVATSTIPVSAVTTTTRPAPTTRTSQSPTATAPVTTAVSPAPPRSGGEAVFVGDVPAELDAWIFVVSGTSITRVDVLSGEQVVVASDVDLSPRVPGSFGSAEVINDNLVVVGAKQILVVSLDPLVVETLPLDGMALLAGGDDEIWTASSSVGIVRAIHRIPLDGSPITTVEIGVNVPFAFLTVAAVPEGLLVSEVLGATWLVSGEGQVTRRDDIASVLAAGRDTYLASTCSQDELICDVAVFGTDGSSQPAIVTNDFSFGSPLSPDGKWLAGAGGFIDISAGTRGAESQELFGSQLGSWSEDSRWFVEPTRGSIQVYDVTGEFASFTITGLEQESELQLVLK